MFRQGRRCSILLHDAVSTVGKSSWEAQVVDRVLSGRLACTSGASLPTGAAQALFSAEPLTLRSLQRAFSALARQQGVPAGTARSLRQVSCFIGCFDTYFIGVCQLTCLSQMNKLFFTELLTDLPLPRRVTVLCLHAPEDFFPQTHLLGKVQYWKDS